jgi:hypothetical protein
MEVSEVKTGAGVFSKDRSKSGKSLKSVFKTGDYFTNECKAANGLNLLAHTNDDVITACFFNPQYRGIMDKMKYNGIVV